MLGQFLRSTLLVTLWILAVPSMTTSLSKQNSLPSLMHLRPDETRNMDLKNPKKKSNKNAVNFCGNNSVCGHKAFPESSAFSKNQTDLLTTKILNFSHTSNASSYAQLNNSCVNASRCEQSNTTDVSVAGEALKFWDKLAIVIFGFICVVGVLGNSFVCYTFGYKCRKRRTITETLILYLAIADIIASLFNPLLYIYWIATGFKQWDFGIIGCKILPPIAPISTTASASIIILICIDRYRSIVTPFKARLNITQINMIVLLLMITSVLSYTFYIIKLDIVPGMTCLPPSIGDVEYTIPYVSVTLVFDFMYVAIFVPAYIRIFYQLRANNDFNSGTTLWINRRKGTRKVLRMLFTVGVVFAVLVFPRDIVQLVFSFSWLFPPGLPRSDAIVTLNYWLKLLHVSNSCVNIFIYSHMHDNFKKELKILFKKLIRRHTFNSEENELTDRGTSIDNTEYSVTRSRTNSLLHMLSFKSKANFKGRKRSYREADIGHNTVEGKRSPSLSPNFAKRIRSKQNIEDSPVNRSPIHTKKGNVTFSDEVMQRLEDALKSSTVMTNSAYPSEIQPQKKNIFLDNNESIDENINTKDQTDIFCKDHSSCASQKTVTVKEELDLEAPKLLMNMNGTRICSPSEAASEKEASYHDRLAYNVKESSYHYKETPKHKIYELNSTFNEFATSRLFGINYSPISSKTNTTDADGDLKTSLLRECEGLSEPENLLGTPLDNDVTIDYIYDERDLACLLRRAKMTGLKSRETNC